MHVGPHERHVDAHHICNPVSPRTSQPSARAQTKNPADIAYEPAVNVRVMWPVVSTTVMF